MLEKLGIRFSNFIYNYKFGSKGVKIVKLIANAKMCCKRCAAALSPIVRFWKDPPLSPRNKKCPTPEKHGFNIFISGPITLFEAPKTVPAIISSRQGGDVYRRPPPYCKLWLRWRFCPSKSLSLPLSNPSSQETAQ